MELQKGIMHVIKDISYEGLCTSVKSVCEETENIREIVRFIQSSALRPLLFSVVTDEVTK